MKKYLAILLTVLMLFSSVSALAEYEGYFKTNVGLVNLPLTDQEETLSYAGYDSWLSNYSYKDDQPIWKLFEEQTGVKIDFQVYSSGELESALSVRLTSGMNLPDITQLPPSWTNTGVMKYVDEGVIIDLTDLIDQYAPNIKALMEEDPYLAAQMIAPDGRIYSVMDVMYPINEVVPISFIIRRDWLEKLNLEVPTTVDDFYNVLHAFATQDPNGNGKADEIPLIVNEVDGTVGYFGTGFGLPYTAINDNVYAFDEEGNCTFLFATEEAKATLEFVNKLYNDGLIYKELTNDVSVVESLIAQNLVGCYPGQPVDWLSRANSLTSETNGDWIMIAPPVDENGHTAISKRFPTGMYYGISADCKNPELAIKWIDYIGFSAEANFIKDFGIEGKTFVYDEDGEPQFTDYIMNNPDGYSPHDAMRTVGGAPSVLVFDTPENYLMKFAGSTVYDCIIALQPYMVDANPLILPSQEESAAYSEVWPDIQVYYKEMFARFISGSESLDNFDGFVETMNDIGLDKVLEIKSNQMHRYKEYMNSIG